MENHITSKRKKEQMFLKIKENKHYIFNPMEFMASVGAFLFIEKRSFLYQIYEPVYYTLQVRRIGS